MVRAGLTPDTSHLRPASTLLVGVSGGADSVALLLALHAQARRRRWTLAVAHLDHGIRGKAAAEDAAFVARLARSLKVPCLIGRARVPILARRRGISLEMAAREARYAFFVRAARQFKATTVVTAHTADDQAETVLLRLLRGAGPAGLAGIPVVSRHHGLTIVRPLLNATRRQVEAFLAARRQPWREDATNRDPAMLRNRVRHQLLPQLERDFNPRVREALRRASRLVAADDAFLDLVADGLRRAHGRGLGSDELEREPLQACVPALRRRVLRRGLREAGVHEDGLDYEAMERVSAFVGRGKPGDRLAVADGLQVAHTEATLKVGRAGAGRLAPVRVRLRVPGVTRVAALGLTVTATVAAGLVRERDTRPGRWPVRATLSLDAWRRRALDVRTPRPGDRMRPFGLKGTRKLQDILVDAKVPRGERGRLPVIECSGEIVWVPGYRIAAAWAVADPLAPALQLAVARLGRNARIG